MKADHRCSVSASPQRPAIDPYPLPVARHSTRSHSAVLLCLLSFCAFYEKACSVKANVVACRSPTGESPRSHSSIRTRRGRAAAPVHVGVRSSRS
jgi:hypothetical protein